MKKAVYKEFSDVLDTVFVVSSEACEGAGEDSFCCSVTDYEALIGVFDGCGGLGARQYEHFEKHTGAYVASRLVSGAAYDWFQKRKDSVQFDHPVEELKDRFAKALHMGEHAGGNALKIRGSMVRNFPSTAAMALAEQKEGSFVVNAIWAGDSRVYLLDQDGLSPLSKDDTDGGDAFEDLRNDPVQTNVLSSDRNFVLHCRETALQRPVVVIAATDGYFGYWNTPMDFEWFILDTLYRSDSVYAWKHKLKTEILEVAGDDATMALMLLHFGTFQKVKSTFQARYKKMKEEYILPLTDTVGDEKAEELWQQYRQGYERYIK